MKINGAIFLALLVGYIYVGAKAHWWDVMLTWTPESWAIFLGGVMLAWVGSDNLGKWKD